MKKYIKWLLASLVTVIFIACGGGGGGGSDTTQKPEVELTFPKGDDVLIHFEQTNGDASGDYTRENEQGESRLYGTAGGVNFSITSQDGLPSAIMVGNSNATFTHNGDGTVNYQIYIDGNLLIEESNMELPSLPESVTPKLKVMDIMVKKSSPEECKAKRQDIAIYYRMLVKLILFHASHKFYGDFYHCISACDLDALCEAECPKKHPEAMEEVRGIISFVIFYDLNLIKLLDDYEKSGCTESSHNWRPEVEIIDIIDFYDIQGKYFDDLFSKYNHCPSSSGEDYIDIDVDDGHLRCEYENGSLTDFSFYNDDERFYYTADKNGKDERMKHSSETFQYDASISNGRYWYFAAYLGSRGNREPSYSASINNIDHPDYQYTYDKYTEEGVLDYHARYSKAGELLRFCKYDETGQGGYDWCDPE